MTPDESPWSHPYDELAMALDELGRIASTSPGVLPPTRMRDVLDRVLADLGDVLVTRFDREEGAGYRGAAALADPSLARSAESLREQHRQLVGRVAALRREAAREDVARLQREVFVLVRAIQVHEHGELGLLQRAIASEMGELELA